MMAIFAVMTIGGITFVFVFVFSFVLTVIVIVIVIVIVMIFRRVLDRICDLRPACCVGSHDTAQCFVTSCAFALFHGGSLLTFLTFRLPLLRVLERVRC